MHSLGSDIYFFAQSATVWPLFLGGHSNQGPTICIIVARAVVTKAAPSQLL